MVKFTGWPSRRRKDRKSAVAQDTIAQPGTGVPADLTGKQAASGSASQPSAEDTMLALRVQLVETLSRLKRAQARRNDEINRNKVYESEISILRDELVERDKKIRELQHQLRNVSWQRSIPDQPARISNDEISVAQALEMEQQLLQAEELSLIHI